jgi:hypothetical protein
MHFLWARDVAMHRDRLSSHALDLIDHGRDRVHVAPAEHKVGAFARQRLRDCRPHSLARAGQDRDPAGEIHGYVPTLSVASSFSSAASTL